MRKSQILLGAVVLAGVAAACSSSSDSTGATGSSSSGAGAGSSQSSVSSTSSSSSGQGGASSSSSSTSSSSTSSSSSSGSGGAPPLGNGKTYYVDTQGDDANDGSAAKPWATIQHAGVVLQTGDTVLVRAGAYVGAVFCYDGPNQGPFGTIAGTAGNPITFEADPAAAPGAVVIDSRNAKTPAGFDLEPGCDFVNVVGFTFDNTHDWSMTDAAIRVNGNGDVVANDTVSYVNCSSKPANHTAAAAEDAGGKGFGVIADNVAGVVLEGNDVSFTCGDNTKGHGLYLSGQSSSAVIHGNRFHDNGALGIHINGDPNLVTQALLDGNFIFDNGGNGINADGLQSSTIQNNVLWGNDKNGITLYQIDAGGPSQDDVIVANTIVQPSSTGAAIRLAADVGPTTNITVFDNILLGGPNGAFDNDAGCTCTSDYNIAAAAPMSGDPANDQHSSVHAAAALGFMSLAGNDYRLTAGSPAIDAGLASFNGKTAPATDVAGGGRPKGSGYDVGAFEH